MANLVLAGYIFAAYLEDVTDRKKKVDGKNDWMNETQRMEFYDFIINYQYQ